MFNAGVDLILVIINWRVPVVAGSSEFSN